MPNEYAGYCRYHRKKLTVKDIKFKSCLMKENIGNICPHMVKYEHPWWIEREEKKERRRLRNEHLRKGNSQVG